MANVMCVSTFGSGAGYAWQFIYALYAEIAESHEGNTFVAFPSVDAAPEIGRAKAVALDARMVSLKSIWETAKFVHRNSIRYIYNPDCGMLPVISYLLLRLAGVRRVVLHDHDGHTSEAPHGLKFVLKWLAARMPFMHADAVVAVSRFVAERLAIVNLTPRSRIHLAYNAIRMPAHRPGELRSRYRIERDRPIIFAACRAAKGKGIEHLLRAFDACDHSLSPVLFYAGSGPEFEYLKALRETLLFKDDIILAGYVPEAQTLAWDAQMCISPSISDEAFCLAVLEGMVLGKPVIASSIGAIPELVENGVTGLLVPPANVQRLTETINWVLSHPNEAAEMGRAARDFAKKTFDPDREYARVCELLLKRDYRPRVQASEQTAGAS